MPIWEKKISASFSLFFSATAAILVVSSPQNSLSFSLCLWLLTFRFSVCLFGLFLYGQRVVRQPSCLPSSGLLPNLCLIGSWVILITGEGQERRGRKEHRCLSPAQAVCPLVCWYSDKLTMDACQISQEDWLPCTLLGAVFVVAWMYGVHLSKQIAIALICIYCFTMLSSPL